MKIHRRSGMTLPEVVIGIIGFGAVCLVIGVVYVICHFLAKIW